MEVKNTMMELIGKLPEEYQEEGSTGRDVIDNIIYEAEKQERERIIQEIESHALKGKNSFSKIVLFEGCIEIRPGYTWWQALKEVKNDRSCSPNMGEEPL